MRPTSSWFSDSMRCVRSPSATDSSTRTAPRSGRAIDPVMTMPSRIADVIDARTTETTMLVLFLWKLFAQVASAVFSMAATLRADSSSRAPSTTSSTGSRFGHMLRARALLPAFTRSSTRSWTSRNSLKSNSTSFALARSAGDESVARYLSNSSWKAASALRASATHLSADSSSNAARTAPCVSTNWTLASFRCSAPTASFS